MPSENTLVSTSKNPEPATAIAALPSCSHRALAVFALSALATAVTGASQSALAQSSAQRVEEVTISATRLPRSIEDIAGTVTLVTAENLDRQIANDLEDVVRFQPGVSMDTATRGGNQGFSIRGIGGNRVLTVIDGVRGNDIYAAGPSSYGKDSFELDTLKTVEIIRGPASVLYGADAMGGAVILTSKTARDYVQGDNGQYIGLNTSAADADAQYKAGVTAAWQQGDLGVLAQFTHRRFAEQQVNGPGRLNPQDGESDSFLLKGFWDLAPGQQLTLSAEQYQDQNLIDVQTDVQRSVTSSRGRDETERRRFGLIYDLEANTVLLDSLQLVMNYQSTDALQNTVQERTSFSFLNPRDRSTFGGTRAIRDTDFEFNQATQALNLNLQKTLGSGAVTHSLAYGLNYDETETERPRNRCEESLSTGATTCTISAFPFAPPEVFPNKTFPDSTTTRYGVYLQDEITVAGTGLTLIPGLRYDRYQLDPRVNDPLLDGAGDIENFGGFSVVPLDVDQTSLSLGALYDLNETYSLFAQYAEGYRPPNFDEANQAFVNLGFGYASIPNPDVQPESSRGLEAGLRASFANAFVSVAAYHNSYENFIESTFVGVENEIRLFQDRNVGEVTIRGVEANANVYLNEQWQVRGSLAYSRGDNEISNTPIDMVDPLTTVLGLSYDRPNGRWGGELMLTLVGEKDRVSAPDVATADAYSVVDTVGYYNLAESATLRFGVFNLLDEQYARWGNIQGLPADDLEQIANAQQPGTNFRLGLNIEF
ncbi:MAG: TonB-dependent hemoglobin/transferrin/lactoferrin family receptor [Pseudohongiellaceae bacterium]